MLDKYYTPSSIAELMVGATKLKAPSNIADFASGDGILLNCALQRWPKAKLYANDISNEALTALKNEITTCNCENIDFLSCNSRISSSFFNQIKSKIDLILLNPPYSFRGQFKFQFKDNSHVSCPRSLAFVLIAIEYLSSSGELIALLPSGAIYGVRGREALKHFSENHQIEIIRTFPDNTFHLCSAKTVLVRFYNRKNSAKRRPKKNVIISKYTIIRGNIQMHTVNGITKSRHKLVHSTSLQEDGIYPIPVGDIKNARIISGYNVLIQRVGNIKKHKVTYTNNCQPLLISDCIIAIPTSTLGESRHIVDYIYKSWKRFFLLYTGTCAKHLTVHDLKEFLANCPSYSISNDNS